eukprot:1841521-Rhodomonas_salina.1
MLSAAWCARAVEGRAVPGACSGVSVPGNASRYDPPRPVSAQHWTQHTALLAPYPHRCLSTLNHQHQQQPSTTNTNNKNKKKTPISVRSVLQVGVSRVIFGSFQQPARSNRGQAGDNRGHAGDLDLRIDVASLGVGSDGGVGAAEARREQLEEDRGPHHAPRLGPRSLRASSSTCMSVSERAWVGAAQEGGAPRRDVS